MSDEREPAALTLRIPEDPEWEDRFLRALGWLLLQANLFEDALIDLYWLVADKPEWQDAVADMQGLTLGNIWGRRVRDEYEKRIQDASLRARFDGLKPRIEEAIDLRNQFVHASWSFEVARQLMHRTRRPLSGVLEEFQKMKVEDVEAAAERIGTAAEEIMHLYDDTEEATRETRTY
jgi:hypothetical protein